MAVAATVTANILGLQGIEWVILGDHSGGSMQVRNLEAEIFFVA
jgi:hypothetical protein